MLKKIDKTRLEAEKVRKVKDENDERLQQRMKIAEEEEIILQQKRESIITGKQVHREKLIKLSMRKQIQAVENAERIRQKSQESAKEVENRSMMHLGMNKVQASIINEQRDGVAKARAVIEKVRLKEAQSIRERATQENVVARESTLQIIKSLENEEVRMLEQLKQTQNREISQIKDLKDAMNEQKVASKSRLEELSNYRGS